MLTRLRSLHFRTQLLLSRARTFSCCVSPGRGDGHSRDLRDSTPTLVRKPA